MTSQLRHEESVMQGRAPGSERDPRLTTRTSSRRPRRGDRAAPQTQDQEPGQSSGDPSDLPRCPGSLPRGELVPTFSRGDLRRCQVASCPHQPAPPPPRPLPHPTTARSFRALLKDRGCIFPSSTGLFLPSFHLFYLFIWVALRPQR